jgi:hypothetical protein
VPTTFTLKPSDFVQDGKDPYNRITPTKVVFERPCTFDAITTLPETADYEITITASCDAARNEYAKFKLFIDGKTISEITLTSEKPEDYRATARCASGERRIGIRFLNDFWVQEPREDRNLYVHGVVLKRIK